MPKLHDYLQSDLNVFFNPDEFGEWHTLGTKEVLMIIDDESVRERPRQDEELENATQNIYDSIFTVSLKATDYKKPKVGSRITLDEKKYYVVGASSSDGILTIKLGANESYG